MGAWLVVLHPTAWSLAPWLSAWSLVRMGVCVVALVCVCVVCVVGGVCLQCALGWLGLMCWVDGVVVLVCVAVGECVWVW